MKGTKDPTNKPSLWHESVNMQANTNSCVSNFHPNIYHSFAQVKNAHNITVYTLIFIIDYLPLNVNFLSSLFQNVAYLAFQFSFERFSITCSFSIVQEVFYPKVQLAGSIYFHIMSICFHYSDT